MPSQAPRPLSARVVENAGAVGKSLSCPAPSLLPLLAPPSFLMVLACWELTLPEPKVFVSCDVVNYGLQKKDRVLVEPQTSPTSLYPCPKVLPDTAKLTVRAPSRRGLRVASGRSRRPNKSTKGKLAYSGAQWEPPVGSYRSGLAPRSKKTWSPGKVRWGVETHVEGRPNGLGDRWSKGDLGRDTSLPAR